MIHLVFLDLEKGVLMGLDVTLAPLIPMEFWVRARKEVRKVNPNVIFLSESVHLGFVKYIRDLMDSQPAK